MDLRKKTIQELKQLCKNNKFRDTWDDISSIQNGEKVKIRQSSY